MLGEPLVLGLIVAPSWGGFGVAVAAAGAFLARHPLKLALADRRRRARSAHTPVAVRFVLLYGAATATGLALAARRGGPGWWLPLVPAALLALGQLAYDAAHRGRQLLPELLGAVALGSIASAEMRAAGWPLDRSLGAWAICAAKAVATVLYVRTRLHDDRGRRPDRTAAIASHAFALVLAVALAAAGLAPWLVVAAFGVLFVRAAHGLSRLHRRMRAQSVGILELAYGFTFVMLAAVGYALAT